MKRNNPFTLTFGKQPNEYISRYEKIELIVGTFEADNPVSQTYLVEGVRGSGKTVLLTAITKELSQRDDWVTVDLNSTQDLLTELASRLVDACKRLPDVLQSGFSISVAGFGVGINGGAKPQDNISVIEQLCASLKKKKKKLLITVDEVMHNQNMRHFTSEFQLFVRKDYPVFLLMTGLYENIYAVQNDPALTFLLRSPKVHLEPLSLHQITRQYKEIFDIDMDAAKQLAHITKGYAFAFQALGMLYFEWRDTLPLEKILLKLDDMLDDFVYKKIWSTLSEQDRNIVRAITEDKAKVKDICDKIGMQSSTFSKYRERLIRRGIIEAVQHGYVALTLPRFSYIVASYA